MVKDPYTYQSIGQVVRYCQAEHALRYLQQSNALTGCAGRAGHVFRVLQKARAMMIRCRERNALLSADNAMLWSDGFVYSRDHRPPQWGVPLPQRLFSSYSLARMSMPRFFQSQATIVQRWFRGLRVKKRPHTGLLFSLLTPSLTRRRADEVEVDWERTFVTARYRSFHKPFPECDDVRHQLCRQIDVVMLKRTLGDMKDASIDEATASCATTADNLLRYMQERAKLFFNARDTIEITFAADGPTLTAHSCIHEGNKYQKFILPSQIREELSAYIRSSRR